MFPAPSASNLPEVLLFLLFAICHHLPIQAIAFHLNTVTTSSLALPFLKLSPAAHCPLSSTFIRMGF